MAVHWGFPCNRCANDRVRVADGHDRGQQQDQGPGGFLPVLQQRSRRECRSRDASFAIRETLGADEKLMRKPNEIAVWASVFGDTDARKNRAI